ncbi:histone-lysine N-methyltransferase SETMAR [Plakobranchus ocellatus]|uniref:Histone-lysine N-methyltransferase SETMAR n=1 Tax=Plakobranchus ocellatus TaxID=259542 RepID=A0AAV4A816_9GAST|nr:histone-lysine N-methyltransferase SETMAR [Plakobranchus ocellatus]
MSKRITPFASRYCRTLDRLKEAIRRKRPGLLRRGVVLQHDNAIPHSANLTQQWLQRYGWEILPHPAHSPDLAPSDFHLFGPLKRHLGGMAFETEDDLISELRNWFDNLDVDFFRTGFLVRAATVSRIMRGHVMALPFPLSNRASDVRPGCKTHRTASTLRQMADLVCASPKEREYFKTCIVGHVNCCLQCGPTLMLFEKSIFLFGFPERKQDGSTTSKAGKVVHVPPASYAVGARPGSGASLQIWGRLYVE